MLLRQVAELSRRARADVGGGRGGLAHPDQGERGDSVTAGLQEGRSHGAAARRLEPARPDAQYLGLDRDALLRE
jgi:hypothetical protein